MGMSNKIIVGGLVAMYAYRRSRDGFQMRFMSVPDWIEGALVGYLAYRTFMKG